MHSLIDILIGLVGFAVLGVVYYAFQFQWPESYKSLSSTFQLKVQERLWRLIAFRSAPVFVVAVLTWTAAHSLGGSGWLSVTVAVALHILATNGKAFRRSLNPHRPESVVNYGSYHLLAALLAAAAGVAGSLAAPYSRGLIPTAQTIIDSVWTALIVALLAGVVLRATSQGVDGRDASAPQYRYERALRDAGIEVFDTIFREASAAGTDPLLARAIAVSEILQRPRWFRQAERIRGKVHPTGSYGVMQMASERPLSDLESIRRFCSANQGEPSFAVESLVDDDTAYAHSKLNRFWFATGRHNGDIEFIEATESSYDWYVTNTEWLHLETSFGSLGVLEKRRYATEWGLRIATTSEVVEIRLDDGTLSVLKRPSGSTPTTWWYFEYRCSMLEENVCFTEGGQELHRCLPLRRNAFFV